MTLSDRGAATTTLVIVVLGVVAFVAGLFFVEYQQRSQILSAVDAIEEGIGRSAMQARGSPPDFTLLVFFSPNDCAACLYETVVLDILAEELQDRLRVLGVVYDLHTAELPAFREGSGIRYPLRNAAQEIERMLGFQRPQGANRPMTMLIDRYGAVVEIAMSGYTIAEHLQHAGELRELIEGDRP